MSNFVSGIFKKCKYGGYFIIYLIAFINLIGFGYCDISQTNINNYNLQYITTLTWSDMNSTNFSYIMPDNNTYCLSINNGIVLSSSSLQINNVYCNNNSCATANSVNNLNGLRYIASSSNITFYNNVFKFTSSATTTEFSNFYADNFICYTPYTGYLSNATYTYMNTAYLRGVSSSNAPNLSVSVYKVNNSSSCPTCPTCPTSYDCNINIGFNDITNQITTKYISDIYTPNGTTKNYEILYNGNINNIDIENTYKSAEILVNSGVSINDGTCENDLINCNTQLNTLSGNYNTCLGELDSCMAGAYNTGDLQRSALYINNIQHLGKPIIQIDIPEEIQRNYNSTGDYFNLTVDGYGYDEQKMLSLIDIQNYKPTGEEMSNLISKFADFVPLLGICLLFIAIRYIVKRIFRG